MALLEWWQSNVIYHIYLPSFKDGNGDGIGDLRGLMSNLDYFVDLQVSTILISPFFPSPMKDNGYDISSFTEIDPMYGSMDDFEELMKEIKQRDMNIILDFVANHTSDQHPWFQKSILREDPYTDFYIWIDAKPSSDPDALLPPNNWLSVFGGSAWTWNEERQQFYFHQFLVEQPDLNYRNPLLRSEMEKVLQFWLDRGVDGFRVDAASHLFEDERLLDEPRAKHTTAKEDEHEYLDHIYTKGQEESLVLLSEWRRILDYYAKKTRKPKVMFIEGMEEPKEIMQYYGSVHRRLADFPFNFLLYKVTRLSTGDGIMKLINDWLKNIPKGKFPNWVLSSHDFPRVAARVGKDLACSLQVLSMLLPGVPICYYGDELGMDNLEISLEDTRDSFALRTNIANSRDPMRTPMQWNADKNAGFTESDNPFLPVNPNYLVKNVQAQNRDTFSTLSIFKRLVLLRQEPSIHLGTFEFALVNETTFSFVRHLVSAKSLVIVLNMSSEPQTVDLSAGVCCLLPDAATLELSTRPEFYFSAPEIVNDESQGIDIAGSSHVSTDIPVLVNLKKICLEGYHCVVLSYHGEILEVDEDS